jgi:hypothetical protein
MYRIKTEEQLIAEFGKDWRNKANDEFQLPWRSGKDKCLGQLVEFQGELSRYNYPRWREAPGKMNYNIFPWLLEIEPEIEF